MRLSPSIVLLRTQTDERLTALAAEGSEPAFTALVERYRRMVLRACMRVLPEARAEDATQQVFVAAWKALTRGDDVRAVRPWLLKIARNTALNALRTPGYEYDELAESLRGGTAPQAELERREVMRHTLSGLASLPENQREALLRTAVQGASHADIARDLGISEGATRQLVLRARATLRSAVSAVTPLPLLNWAASGSTAGVAEVAAGGSTAGAALLAKAGAVAVIAGGAVATPAIVHRVRADDPDTARAAERAPHAARKQHKAASRPIVAKATADATATVTPEGHRRRHHGGAAGEQPRHHGRHRHRHRHHGHGHGRGPDSAAGDDETTTGSSGPGPGGGTEGDDETHGHGGHGKPEPDKPDKPEKPEKPESGGHHGESQETTVGDEGHGGKDDSDGDGGPGSGSDKPKDHGDDEPAATPVPTPDSVTPTPTPGDEGDGQGGKGSGDDGRSEG